jgi:NIMA (never in mitosis gene a)-related kinase
LRSILSPKSQTSHHEFPSFIPSEQTDFASSHSSSKLEDYQKLKKIGSGAFSEVYLYLMKSDGSLFSLKFINSFQSGGSIKLDLEHEVKLLKKLNYSNISQCFDYFPDGDHFVIVMEYIQGETLKQKIKIAREQNKPFSEELICTMFFQILSSLFYCHSLNIIHRDIKPDDLIVTYDNQVKLIDFGLAKEIEFSLKSQTGTWIYMSPEMLREEKYSFNTDIWSLGCILFELMALNHPFSYSQFKYYSMIKDQLPLDFTLLNYSDELKSIVKEMLCYDSSKRITSFQLERQFLLHNYNSINSKIILTFILELLNLFDNKTKEFDHLKSNFKTLQLQKEKLQSEVNQMKKENTILKESNTNFNNENSIFKIKNTKLQNESQQLKNEIQQLKN